MYNKINASSIAYKCMACDSNKVACIEPQRGLFYVCCRECGHSSALLKGDDVALSFNEAQHKYYGETSLLIDTKPDIFETEILARRKTVLAAFLSPASNVIEVGPGGGHVLGMLLAQGHNVTAIEHSPVLARHLSERFKITVMNGEFETIDLPPVMYDAFCSFHVIEHVRDPIAHLRKGYPLVRSGGLTFVATPNALSWQQKLFEPLSPNFDAAHLHVFSKKSLINLCNQCGWEVVSVLTPDYATEWIKVITKVIRRIRGEDEGQTAGKYARSSSKLVKFIAGALRMGTSPLRLIQSKLGYGNEIFLILRKP